VRFNISACFIEGPEPQYNKGAPQHCFRGFGSPPLTILPPTLGGTKEASLYNISSVLAHLSSSSYSVLFLAFFKKHFVNFFFIFLMMFWKNKEGKRGKMRFWLLSALHEL
jgi:hypothetical protein